MLNLKHGQDYAGQQKQRHDDKCTRGEAADQPGGVRLPERAQERQERAEPEHRAGDMQQQDGRGDPARHGGRGVAGKRETGDQRRQAGEDGGAARAGKRDEDEADDGDDGRTAARALGTQAPDRGIAQGARAGARDHRALQPHGQHHGNAGEQCCGPHDRPQILPGAAIVALKQQQKEEPARRHDRAREKDRARDGGVHQPTRFRLHPGRLVAPGLRRRPDGKQERAADRMGVGGDDAIRNDIRAGAKRLRHEDAQIVVRGCHVVAGDAARRLVEHLDGDRAHRLVEAQHDLCGRSHEHGAIRRNRLDQHRVRVHRRRHRDAGQPHEECEETHGACPQGRGSSFKPGAGSL